MKRLRTFFILVLFLFANACLHSCNDEDRISHLFPNRYKLSIIDSLDQGITFSYLYKVLTPIDTTEILDFPVDDNNQDDDIVIKWHQLKTNELRDIDMFFNEEQDQNQMANRIKSQVLTDRFYTAIIYDKDNKPIGEDGYDVYSWMELYLLNIDKSELTHFSYGRF